MRFWVIAGVFCDYWSVLAAREDYNMGAGEKTGVRKVEMTSGTGEKCVSIKVTA